MELMEDPLSLGRSESSNVVRKMGRGTIAKGERIIIQRKECEEKEKEMTTKGRTSYSKARLFHYEPIGFLINMTFYLVIPFIFIYFLFIYFFPIIIYYNILPSSVQLVCSFLFHSYPNDPKSLLVPRPSSSLGLFPHLSSSLDEHTYPIEQQQEQQQTTTSSLGNYSSFTPLTFSSPKRSFSLLSSPTLLRLFHHYRPGHVPSPPALAELSNHFKPEIIQITDDVYVFSGFGLANCVFVNATDGLVIIDTMESEATMENVWREWRRLPGTDRPIRAILYSHFHTDHIFGASVLIKENENYYHRKKDPTFCNLNQPKDRDLNHKLKITYTFYNVTTASTTAPTTWDHSNLSSSTCTASPAPCPSTTFSFNNSTSPFPLVEVWAYWQTAIEAERFITMTGHIQYKRSMRQFGTYVTEGDFINAGIGPKLNYDEQGNIGYVSPTHIMDREKQNISVGGIKLQLIHAPGESKDQIVIYYPAKKLLFGADNVYKSFPNIYAIRGTETRDCYDWIRSLDLMRSIQPNILVLGHAKPIIGKDDIESILLAYRDAIQYIHDQTVRHLNKGLSVQDIALLIKLPPHLSSHPYLQQFYGMVSWSVRAIFTQYMGWFSGNAEDLHQLSTHDKAESLVELAGGYEAILDAVASNLIRNNTQWALELSTACRVVFPRSSPCLDLNVLALRIMASEEPAATGRNWYLTSALELEGTVALKVAEKQKRQALSKFRSMKEVFDFFPFRLNAENSFHLDYLIHYSFVDTNEHLCAVYRRGIAYNTWPCGREPDVEVVTRSSVFRSLLLKDISPISAVARGDLKVKGSIWTLIKCLARVETDVE